MYRNQIPSLTVKALMKFQEQAGFATSSIESRLSCVRSHPFFGAVQTLVRIQGLWFRVYLAALTSRTGLASMLDFTVVSKHEILSALD